MKNIVIGAIVGVFGLKGELKFKAFLSNEEILETLKTVFIRDNEGVVKEISIKSLRPHKELWVVKLEGVNNPEDAMRYKGLQMEISEAELPPAEEDEVYWIHIKGLPVVDTEGKKVGTLDNFIETGMHDVFQIAGYDGKEYLISNNPDHVKKIDLENKQVIVNRLGLVSES